MAINVTDIESLPTTIFVVNLSKISTFATEEFLDSIIKKVGVTRNDYYLLPTDGNISWLQPTKELTGYHMFLRILRVKKGFNYLMIIKDKTNV